jgi:hypothetical protein
VTRKIANKLLLLSAFFICAACSTDYQSWEFRNAEFHGRGGLRKVVHGMDLWTSGAPDRRFRVLGVIRDQDVYPKVVRKARAQGGDALILISSSTQLQGYYTGTSGSTQVYGNYWGYSGFSGTATSFGSAYTVPITQTTLTLAVIKYLN